MMTQTWIVFTIKDKQVYQISYNGCTGQDLIDSHKSMIAYEHKVSENEVKISFRDGCEMVSKGIVCPDLLREAKEVLKNLN